MGSQAPQGSLGGARRTAVTSGSPATGGTADRYVRALCEGGVGNQRYVSSLCESAT